MTEPIRHVHAKFGGECSPEDISPYVLLPTAAHQVEKIAAHWEEARKVARHYEFLIYSGKYRGVPLSACSTGIGGASLATAIEELARLGAHTFIHAGLANPPIGETAPGDLTIATGAVRFDSSSHGYVRPEYPALAHYKIVQAAISAAEHNQVPYHVGVVASFAASGLRQTGGRRHFLNRRTASQILELEQAGVYGGSGEEATLFTQSSIYGFRAGAIIGSPNYRDTQIAEPHVEDIVLKVGLDALFALASWDLEIQHSDG